jgi:ATP-dependent 26S proteasome regulatory subunit
LEVHIEIALPTEAGRSQILRIKTSDMRRANRLEAAAEANMELLAQRTKNFTGNCREMAHVCGDACRIA